MLHRRWKKKSAQIRQMFQNDGITIPVGFTDEDVNFDAPPLYSGMFRLRYLKFTLNLRAANGLALASASCTDVRKFYRDLAIATLELDDRR